MVTSVDAERFPWPEVALNVVGPVLLGVLLAEAWRRRCARVLLHDLGGTGFRGGLTAFSAPSVEVDDLVAAGHAGTAAVYRVTSVFAAVGGPLAGGAALRRVRALALPLQDAAVTAVAFVAAPRSGRWPGPRRDAGGTATAGSPRHARRERHRVVPARPAGRGAPPAAVMLGWGPRRLHHLVELRPRHGALAGQRRVGLAAVHVPASCVLAAAAVGVAVAHS